MNGHDERDYAPGAEEEISGLYRQLGSEEPPPALDEAILGAAREKPAARPGPLSARPLMSAAASIVLIAFSVLLFTRPDAPLPAASRTADLAPSSAEGEPGLIEISEITVTGVAPGPLVLPNIAEDPAVASTREIIQRNVPAPETADQADGPVRQEIQRILPAPRRIDEGAGDTRQVFESFDNSAQQARLQELLELVEQAQLTETSEQRLTALDAWREQIQRLLEAGRITEAQAELERLRLRYPDADVEALPGLPAEAEDQETLE